MPVDLKIPLELSQVAAYLESLEEKIIFKLLNRAQYRLNPGIYKAGQSHFQNRTESLLDIRFQMQEAIESRFGRFSVPEERPFSDSLPPPERVFEYKQKPPIFVDHYDEINITKKIKAAYLDFIPSICQAGDDGHHGSAVEHDVYLLQTVSERIHFGAFYIAEAKYQQEPEIYQSLAEKKDRRSLFKKLTRRDVEEAIYARLRKKACRYQEDLNTDIRIFVDPEAIVRLYQKVVIPLTKEGEILYLITRRAVEIFSHHQTFLKPIK